MLKEQAKPYRILLVDDNAVNRFLAEEILKLDGYRTTSASSAEQAEELIAEGMPDLIISDIRLPGVDGLEFVRKLRATPATAHIPAIALTAQAGPEDERLGLAAGFNAYVVKPIDMPHLLATIRLALGTPA